MRLVVARDHALKSQRKTPGSRRFGLAVSVLGLLLSVAGVMLLGDAGVLEAIGIGALGYGIGFLVAGVFLATGWRPGNRR
jgi:hypothetical protein